MAVRIYAVFPLFSNSAPSCQYYLHGVTRRPDKAGHVLLFDQNENVRPAFLLLILKAKFLSLNQTQNLSLYLTQQNDHQNYFLRRTEGYWTVKVDQKSKI
jgi:hypothetical protein